MRYALDLDGVLADFHSGFARAAGRLWPGRILAHVPPDDKHYESLGLDRSEVEMIKDEIRKTPNFWAYLPALREGVAAVAFHQIEHPCDEIFYVTARLDDTTGMNIMGQSQIWVENTGIGGLGTAVIVSRDKQDVFRALDVDAALDDDPRYLTGFPQGFLLSQPWNQDYSGSVRRIESVHAFFVRNSPKASEAPVRRSTSSIPVPQP